MILKYGIKVFPRLVKYKLAMWGLARPPHPLFFNFSITNKCQSKCTMCNIWKLYKEFPEKEKKELKLYEIEKVFKTMDPVFQLSICGGEPFLRDDLDKICVLACKHIKPTVIHTPTNCLSPEKIEELTFKIMRKIPKHVKFTIKLSLDGIGKKHDDIRGVEGNFDKLVDTYKRLSKIRVLHPNLYLDAGVTVSMSNLGDIKEITSYVEREFRLDNFLHEIADTRAELFNVDTDKELQDEFEGVMGDLHVTPSGNDYQKVVGILLDDVKEQMKGNRKFSRFVQALRMVYYKRTEKVMIGGKRVVPCYAGISNSHLNPWGGMWLCNVQAFQKEMGNVRDFACDFDKLWHSDRANEMRKFVKSNQCHCPLVGQSFLDTVMSPKEMTKVFWYYFFGARNGKSSN